MRNAAAPMTGGVSCPLVDDATSTAPAFSAGNPTRFISGIVKVPVVTVLAIDEPEISPVAADAATAAFAGPPVRCPIKANASLMKVIAGSRFFQQRAEKDKKEHH